MRAAHWVLVTAGLLGGTGGRAMQSQGPAVGPQDSVAFTREWAEQVVPFYRIEVRGDGTGTETRQKDGGGAVPLRISQATVTKVFAVAPVVTAQKCASGNKHVAKTGEKTLAVVMGGQSSQCAFNYTEDKRVQEAVAVFAAVEVTVEEGPRLEKLVRFDRLGLDAELGSFLQQAKDGRAIELVNVRPVLEKLVNNAEVMERVRSRASELLSMADAGR